MRAATGDWFKENDLVAQWLAERTEPVAEAHEGLSKLHRDYVEWCIDSRATPLSMNLFGKDMRARTDRHEVPLYAPGQKKGVGKVLKGLKLKPAETSHASMDAYDREIDMLRRAGVPESELPPRPETPEEPVFDESGWEAKKPESAAVQTALPLDDGGAVVTA